MREEEEDKEIAQVGQEQVCTLCKAAVPSVGRKKNEAPVGCISVKREINK